MTLLVIDTATAACSVALLEGGEVVSALHEVVGRGHAERLVPSIAECLAGHPTPAAILVDCGPGSFTGVRVGLAAARALALGWGVPAHGYSSLALLAAMVGGEVAAALVGGHGELFVQRFVDGVPRTPLASLPPAIAAEAVPDALVVGSGAATLIAARGHGEARDLLPDAAQAWRLKPGQAALPPSPIYGRAPDAKVPS